jgi:hypothetical protein
VFGGYRSFLPQCKRQGLEFIHWPPTVANIKNGWSHTSISHIGHLPFTCTLSQLLAYLTFPLKTGTDKTQLLLHTVTLSQGTVKTSLKDASGTANVLLEWFILALYLQVGYHTDIFGYPNTIMSALRKKKICHLFRFRFCKSVHYYTFNWINQPDAANFQVYYLSFNI